MEKIKSIAVDLDGTLLKNDRSICANSHSELKRVNGLGIKVIVSTICTFQRFKSLYDELGFQDPLIFCGGAEKFSSKDGGIDVSYSIPVSATKKVTTFAERHEIKLSISTHEFTYWKKSPEYKGTSAKGIVTVENYSEALHSAPIRML